MSGYVLKGADRRIVVSMDWSQGYLAEGEAVEADLGWSVQPDHGTSVDLAVTEQHHDAVRSGAALEGGVPGKVYMVTSRVRTSGARVLARAIVVRIALG